MGQIHKRASAKQDLADHFIYLAENADLDTAERFLSRAENSFRDLAAHPFLGPELTVRSEALKGIRKWRVRDFDNFLIFYQPDADGVTIVRVLHASRDWWTLLGLL